MTGTGLQGNSVESLITKFFGKLEQWPTEPVNGNFSQSQIKAICEHISATGDCLWHAESVVLGWAVCPCLNCVPDRLRSLTSSPNSANI